MNKNLKNPSADVFCSTSFRAAVMVLRLKANFHASPAITTRCCATKDITRAKTPAFKPKKPFFILQVNIFDYQWTHSVLYVFATMKAEFWDKTELFFRTA